ncbi:MoaF-related domain-containing protein [Rhizobium sp. G21]|uniref:nuclear transport factor 2 family protein n=1 Tax=Rhizobium sp. G21 TaxID=2758439 RepID=UPI001FEDDE12|nr:nuclear transport factor 2 family protein [Rhizobium sp. G21]
MTDHGFPTGLEMDVSYPNFRVSLTLLSISQLRFEIKEGPFARTETVDIEVAPIGNGVFAVSWREESGATVANIQDYDRGLVFSFATLPDGRFLRMTGAMTITRPAARPADNLPQRNKALVLDAMTSLFQRRDAAAVERLYAVDYIQHNPAIAQGRDALRAIVAQLPEHVHYEPGLILAEDDLVAIHGRIRGWAEEPLIAIDVFRVEDGKLAEHWDVLQTETAAAAAEGRVPMFDPGEAMRDARRGRT